MTCITPTLQRIQPSTARVEPDSCSWPAKYRRTAWYLVAAYFGWFIWQFGTASLALDETITAWVTSSDLATCWKRAWEFQGQSPIYFVLVWIVRLCIGESELALRSISLMAVAGTSRVTYLLLKELGVREDAWAGAMIIAVAMAADFDVGIAARPYALAIFSSLCSLLFLLRWLERPSWQTWLAYSAASLATVSLHYVFAAMVLMHCGVVATTGKPTVWRLANWLGSWLAAGTALTPLVPHVLAVARKASRYEMSMPPSLDSTLHFSLATGGILQIAAVALICGLVIRRAGSVVVNKRSAWLGAAWWAAGPISIAMIYLCFGVTLNVPRYFAWRVPALGLLAVTAIQLVYPRRFIALPAIVLLGFVLPILPQPDRSGWREAFRWGAPYMVRGAAYEPVVYTGLIETADPTWLDDDRYRDYMMAPAHHYNGPQAANILPICVPRSAQLFEHRLQELFASHDQLIFFLRLIPEVGSRVRRCAQESGFTVVASCRFGLVETIAVSRSEGTRTPPAAAASVGQAPVTLYETGE